GGRSDLAHCTSTTLNDTWLWTGSTSKWQKCNDSQCNPGLLLTARYGHRMEFVTQADGNTVNKVILFGGQSGGTVNNETWELDGGQWTLCTSACLDSPTASCCGGLAYDSLHARLVLFGGAAQGGGRLGDTWLWNGNDWCLVGSTCFFGG
ncbi:MAG TPA: hypothetical protein VF972_09505, partial [Actinomycetota bacterium]